MNGIPMIGFRKNSQTTICNNNENEQNENTM